MAFCQAIKEQGLPTKAYDVDTWLGDGHAGAYGETIYQTLPDVEKIGAHIAEHKARIDFALPQAITPHLPALQARIDALVAAKLAITSAFSDAASGRRYWELPGIARVPCGGTHLRHSGEVGRIALKRKNVGRGKERVEITLLDDAPA